MLRAMDVANFFIDTYNSLPEGNITNLTLNKLLYFAQGHNMARNGCPLFSDDIEAWDYGPVVPEVYRTFKSYKNRPITSVKGKYNYSEIDGSDIELLIDVVREYSKYSAYHLVNMTHAVGTPWKNSYISGENVVISPESLKEYFEKQEILAEYHLPEGNEENFIGRRNAKGILVLPEEYDDAE